jgi:hypothetical protein
VQFQPPEGARPGEIGTLVDEKADPVDVTATIIDLAVRGWLRIEEVPRENPRKKPKDWTLVRLRPGTEGLLPFEAWLLSDLFEKTDEITLSELKTTFASSLAKVQSMLYDHVTSVGWFRANPKSVRAAWIVVGVLLSVIGLFGAIALCGGASLFLAGTGFFWRRLAGWWPWTRLGSGVILLAVIPLIAVLPALGALAAVTAVVVALLFAEELLDRWWRDRATVSAGSESGA